MFLKYLWDVGIENFWWEVELVDNYFKEIGLMVIYFGYGVLWMVLYLKWFDEVSIVE